MDAGRRPEVDLYALLGVEIGVDQRALELAYRRLCRRYHPDVSREPDAERRMREINAAYEVLGDRLKRLTYDRTRSVREPSAVAWAAARRVWRESARAPGPRPEGTRPPGAAPPPQARVRVWPGAIDFGFIARGHVATRTLRVRSAAGVRVLTRGDWLRVDRAEVGPAEVELTVTADPRQLHAFWDGAGAETARIDGFLELVDRDGTMRLPAGAILRRDAATGWWNPFSRRVG
jgi:hypothetical protein